MRVNPQSIEKRAISRARQGSLVIFLIAGRCFTFVGILKDLREKVSVAR